MTRKRTAVQCYTQNLCKFHSGRVIKRNPPKPLSSKSGSHTSRISIFLSLSLSRPPPLVSPFISRKQLFSSVRGSKRERGAERGGGGSPSISLTHPFPLDHFSNSQLHIFNSIQSSYSSSSAAFLFPQFCASVFLTGITHHFVRLGGAYFNCV